MSLSSHSVRSIRTFSSSSRRTALSALAHPKAEALSAEWKGTSATGKNTKLFINGEFVESEASEYIDVHDPVCDFMILRDAFSNGLAIYIVHPDGPHQGSANHLR